MLGQFYDGISMAKFNNLKVKWVKSNLKYTESKLVKKRPLEKGEILEKKVWDEKKKKKRFWETFQG